MKCRAMFQIDRGIAITYELTQLFELGRLVETGKVRRLPRKRRGFQNDLKRQLQPGLAVKHRAQYFVAAYHATDDLLQSRRIEASLYQEFTFGPERGNSACLLGPQPLLLG